jgi:hypothetical protein
MEARMRWLWILVLGCGEPQPAPSPVTTPVTEAIAPAGHPVAAPVASAAGNEGTILETMDSGSYTYARLDLCGAEAWVAGPQTAVKLGDVVALQGNMPMRDFHSSTLDRTFAAIRFVSGMRVKDGPADCSGSVPPGHPPMPAPVATPSAAAGSRQGRVVQTMESAGYRYAEVDFCGSTSWIAGPATPVEVGQTIETGPGSTMHDFRSSSLDRTFASIDFVRSVAVVDGEPRCAP